MLLICLLYLFICVELRRKVKIILNFLARSLVKWVLMKANSLASKSNNVGKVILMLLQNKV